MARAFQSSYDRPYYRGTGSGHLMTDDFCLVRGWRRRAWTWATPPTRTWTSGDFLSGAKVVFLSGHDQYLVEGNPDRAGQSLAEERSLINLGANQGYWQVRLEPSKDGAPGRIVTCYKGDTRDPVGDMSPLRTTKFRDAPVSRPENSLFGIMFNSPLAPVLLPAGNHRSKPLGVLEHGPRAGDTMWMANGYEMDGIVTTASRPRGCGVLAESPRSRCRAPSALGRWCRRQGGA